MNRLLKATRSCRRSAITQIVQFALATGMRRGEIANMQWKDAVTHDQAKSIA
ncbi:hypothetical protein [Bradyrhizobium sp. RT11b]|uniref:hypothetical protein n=1 Tax=Bradyrhizobium sp. RT11b TaxID=3156332 RepID=UPI0033982653